MTISHADPPTVLLENGFMVHKQMNMETISHPFRECFPMFPWSKRLAQTMLKVKMERNT